MDLTKGIKKSITTFAKKFNKNNSIEIDADEICKLAEKNLINIEKQGDAAKICKGYITLVMQYVTDKMKASIDKNESVNFKGIPAKVEEFTSNTLRDIIAEKRKFEEDMTDYTMNSGSDDMVPGEIFSDFASQVLKNEDKSMSDMAIMEAKDKVKKGEDESTVILKITENLRGLTKNARDYYNGEHDINRFSPSNAHFNLFLKTISVSYNAVHELYNEKSFFGKWLTPSGWALRSAMNETKTVVKNYYNQMAMENHKKGFSKEELIESEELTEDEIAPTIDGKEMDKISTYLNGYSKEARVQVSIDSLGNINSNYMENELHTASDLELFTTVHEEDDPEYEKNLEGDDSEYEEDPVRNEI